MKHSEVVGISLHELKGVGDAADDYLLTANGGLSLWKYGSPLNCDATVEPFSNVLHIRDQHTGGTDGADFISSAATYITRPLNTVVSNSISGSSLASNQITLPSGTFIVRGYSVTLGPEAWVRQPRLRNITSSVTLSLGMASPQRNTFGYTTNIISGKFTLSAGAVTELQHFTKGGVVTKGWGIAASSGEDEVYADLMIWKIA